MARIFVDVRPIGETLGKWAGRRITDIAYRLGGPQNDTNKTTPREREHTDPVQCGQDGDSTGSQSEEGCDNSTPIPRIVLGTKGELIWRYGPQDIKPERPGAKVPRNPSPLDGSL